MSRSESTCRCGARMLWVITEAGKMMPLDAEPAAAGNIVMTGRYVETSFRGRIREVGYLTEGTLFPADATRYVSHFATCPAAHEFRKPKAARR